MANRYDTPLESKFINTYVPIPFEEMVQAGKYKEERYDKGLSAANQAVSQLESLQAESGSPDEERLNTYKKSVVDLLEQSKSKDFSNSFVINDFNSNIRKAVNKNDLLNIVASKAAMDKADAAKQDLMMKNLYNPALDNDPRKTWDSRKGVYGWMPRAYVDKDKIYGDVFAAVQPDYAKKVMVNGLLLLEQGVSDEKIRQTSADLAAMETKTPTGLSLIEQWKILNPGKQKSDYDILYDELLSVGKPRAKRVYEPLPESYFKDRSGKNTIGGPISTPIVYTGGTQSQEPGTDKQILKAKQEEYETAKATLSGMPEKMDDENIKNAKLELQNTVNKYEQTLKVADEAYAKVISTDLSKLRQETFNTFKNVLGDKYSDQEIYNYIDNLVTSTGEEIKEPGVLDYLLEGITTNPFKDVSDASKSVIKKKKATLPTGITHVGIRGSKAKDNLIEGAKATIERAKAAKDAVLSSTYNYSVSERFAYPVPYKMEGGQAIIRDPATTQPYTSNMYAVLQNLPLTLESKKVKIISENGVAKNKILDKDSKKGTGIESAKNRMTSWELVGQDLGLNFDDNGDAIIRLRYAPVKGTTTAQNASAEYELRIPAYDSEFMAIAEDYRHSGQLPLYLQFANYSLQADVKKNINNVNGHDYTLMDSKGRANTVNVRLEGTDYKLTINNQPVATTYKSDKEVLNVLQYLQKKAILEPSE